MEAKKRMTEEDGECPGKGRGVRALLVRILVASINRVHWSQETIVRIFVF